MDTNLDRILTKILDSIYNRVDIDLSKKNKKYFHRRLKDMIRIRKLEYGFVYNLNGRDINFKLLLVKQKIGTKYDITFMRNDIQYNITPEENKIYEDAKKIVISPCASLFPVK